MSYNKNKGIRVPINDEVPLTDLSIISICIEKNCIEAPEVDKKETPYYTFRYILNGKGYAIINGVKYNLLPDTLLVSFPHSNIQLRQNNDDPYTMAWINLYGQKVPYFLSLIGITKNNLISVVEPQNEVRKLLTNTPYKCLKTPNNCALALSCFYSIIDKLQINNISSNTKSIQQQHISNAIEFINNNYSNPELSLTLIAKYLGLNPRYLSTIFKTYSNSRISDFIINKRLAVAEKLLEDSKKTIAEIAYEVGFNSPYYFSNVYKKHNTISPSSHQKKKKENKD